jgi:hypothetical protein
MRGPPPHEYIGAITIVAKRIDLGTRRAYQRPKRAEIRIDDLGRIRVYVPIELYNPLWCQAAANIGGWWHVPDGEWCFEVAVRSEIEASLDTIFGESRWDRV